MSPWEVVALIFATMLGTLLLVYTGWRLAQGGQGAKEFGQSWDKQTEPPDLSEGVDVERDGIDLSDGAWHRRHQTPQSEEPPALKIDPENPPTWKRYSPPAGKQPPLCNCHGRPIRQGENILMWPDPEDLGAYRLFHKDFVDSLGAGLA